MHSQRFSWLVRQKSFISMVGAEYELVKRSGSAVLGKFYISAVTILVILLVTLVSMFYAMELLFHKWYVEIGLAVFFSLLFGFIYIFLLNTFTKEAFHTGNKYFNISNFSRIGFVMFMAFIIAKPLEIYFMEGRMAQRVAAYKSELLSGYAKKVAQVYRQDLHVLAKYLESYQAQYHQFPTATLSESIKKTTAEIHRLQEKKQALVDKAQAKLDASSFFLYKVQTVVRFPLSWLICLTVVAVFLVPGFLFYSISGNDAYYKMKKSLENGLVVEEYGNFCNAYRGLFLSKYGLDRSFYSGFEDPPFNKKRKPLPTYNAQADFLKRYLP
jgi:hypothetical protein